MDIHDYTLPSTDRQLLAECDVQTFRGTGPGGQGVNTTDSAVRLSHRPTGIVVTARQERSQHLNKKLALARLRERIESVQRVRTPRLATRKPRGVQRRVVQAKRVLGQRKRLRGRVSSADE